MKIPTLPRAFLLSSLVAAMSLSGAPPKIDGMSRNGLIQCGGQTVYVGFDESDGNGCGGTVSPDGRYAFGWTLNPRAGAKPVDWSKWTLRNDGFDDLFPFNCVPNGNPPYRSVDCIVDLKTRRLFYPLVNQPYAPEETHGDVRCAWSDPRQGTQYALIALDLAWYTGQLLLIRLDADGLHTTDLTKQLNKALIPLIKDKRPLENPRDFNTIFNVWPDDGPHAKHPAPPATFTAAEVEIPFLADIMHSGWAEALRLEVDGVITARLPEGQIVGVSSATPQVDPFRDDPKLAQADRRMNQLYGELLRLLSPVGRDVLRKDQLMWIQERDGAAHDAVNAPTATSDTHLREVRNASYLHSTQDRAEQLQEWNDEIRTRGRDGVDDVMARLRQADDG
jgi:uncharacterized protein YecT (DUF1311 family)